MAGKKNLKIRLIGEHPADHKLEWRAHFSAALEAQLGATILHDFWEFGVDEAVVAHDTLLIKEADIIVANADVLVGPGTAMEYVLAKHYGKLVITVLHKNAVLKKNGVQNGPEVVDDWIHPFILAFSDHIVASVEDISPAMLQPPLTFAYIDRIAALAATMRNQKGISRAAGKPFRRY